MAARIVLFYFTGHRTFEFARGTVDGLMRVTGVVFHDYGAHANHVRFERAVNVVGAGLQHAMSVGQVRLNAGDALAETIQRVFHYRLQMFVHFVTSVSVRVGLQQDLHKCPWFVFISIRGELCIMLIRSLSRL